MNVLGIKSIQKFLPEVHIKKEVMNWEHGQGHTEKNPNTMDKT